MILGRPQVFYPSYPKYLYTKKANKKKVDHKMKELPRDSEGGFIKGYHYNHSTEFKNEYATFNKSKRKPRVWTNEKVEYLIENYPYKSSREIAEKLNTTKYAVIHKARKLKIRKSRDFRLLLCGKHPDVKITPNLSYILGVMCGDGYLSRAGRHYNVVLGTIDELFARNFAEALEKINLHPIIRLRDRRKSGWKLIFEVVATSKEFFWWYRHLSLMEIKDIVFFSIENTLSFIRGYYESDGCYTGNDDYKQIVFTDGTPHHINLVSSALQRLGFDCRVYKQRSWYNLCLLKQAQISHFLKLINPCIKRGEKR